MSTTNNRNSLDGSHVESGTRVLNRESRVPGCRSSSSSGVNGRQADFLSIRRRFRAAGLDEDFFSGDDIVTLWHRGQTVDEIVRTAIDYAARTGETTASAGP